MSLALYRFARQKNKETAHSYTSKMTSVTDSKNRNTHCPLQGQENTLDIPLFVCMPVFLVPDYNETGFFCTLLNANKFSHGLMDDLKE